jgi:serine/threonine protein kinase
MAPELLNVRERLASADIFSLGLSVYELCFTLEQIAKGTLLLPTEGPLWHKLRDGNSDPLQHRPEPMVSAVHDMLKADPSERPLATEIVSLPDVARMEFDEDESLLNAECCWQQSQSQGLRSSNFRPILRMASVSESDNAAYMAELLARAITPH